MTPEAAAAILGVRIDADRASIEAAFRRKAKVTHPDRFAGGASEELRDAAAQFDRAGRARETLLGRTHSAPPTRSAPTARSRETTPAAPASRSGPLPPTSTLRREAVIILTAALALLLTIGAVVAIGIMSDSVSITTGAAGAVGDPAATALHGLNVIPITDARTVSAHCHGRDACWLWSVASERTCADGIVVIDFYDHAQQSTPTETISQDVQLTAHRPSFVAASRSGFPEPFAHVAHFTC